MTDEARAILEENILGTLATVTEDGAAWATPLHFFFDDGALYWFSGADKEHSVHLRRDGRVSVAIFSQDESKGPKGVYVNGVAEMLDSEETEVAKQLVVDRIGKIPSVFEHAAGFKLPFGELNREKSNGNCWYFYT